MNLTPVTDHPAHMSLYPTMETVVAAIQHIEAQVPIMNRNDLFALLMMYQNTLLKELCTCGQSNVYSFPAHLETLRDK